MQLFFQLVDHYIQTGNYKMAGIMAKDWQTKIYMSLSLGASKKSEIIGRLEMNLER